MNDRSNNGDDPPTGSHETTPHHRETMTRTNLSVVAEFPNARVLRLVVTGKLSLYGFGVDAIDDVRSAVDECCTLVLGDGAGASGRLELTLYADSQGVSSLIQGTFESPPERNLDEIEQAEDRLSACVDGYNIDLAHHRVTFDRNA